MQLPKLDLPTFHTTLPSTGEKVSFRPFTIKEQKIMLMASQDVETADPKDIASAMKDIINVCTFEKLNVNDLPSFDLEYMFLQIRAKSVDQIISLSYTHTTKKDGSPCGHVQNINIDIGKIKVEKNKDHTTKIDLTNDIGVVMKYPSIDSTLSFDENDVESYFELIANGIEKIYTQDEVYPITLEMKPQAVEFVESLQNDQFQKIVKFYQTMPKVQYDLSYTCQGCGEEIKQTLTGIRDFF